MGQYLDCYNTLFSGTGTHYQDEGNDISRLEYADGYSLLAFDLTPDLAANAGTHWNVVKLGNLRLEINFADPLEEAINCIVYAEFDELLQVNKQRMVIIGYRT
jgi:hypothetical protein